MPTPPTTAVNLATLIKQHLARTGDSYTDLARASGLSKAKVWQLSQDGETRQPRQDTIEKLATGLRQPLAVVQTAAMATAGITPDGPVAKNQRIGLLLEQLEHLSPEALHYVEVTVNALIADGRDG